MIEGEERLILTENGKKIAAIVPYYDLEALECIEDTIDVETLADLCHEALIDSDALQQELEEELQAVDCQQVFDCY